MTHKVTACARTRTSWSSSAARWPALVKEAVLLGARPEDAADATVDALSRCRRDWGRASREEDVDALVQAELLLAVRRRPRTSEDGREQRPGSSLVLAPPTLRGASSTRRASTTARASGAPPWSRSRCCSSGSAPASTWRRPATTGSRPPDDGVLENAAISQEENPAPGVIWYADGELHLDHIVLAVEGLQDMTRIGTGVVYGDDEGRVVYAADDGSREVLGHKDPDVPVAATDETGWAAWVETRTTGRGWSIKEVTTGNQVASVPVVDAGAQVVAVDGDTVYYVDDEGRAPAAPGRPTPRSCRSVPPDLLDVRSRIRAFQLDEEHDPGRPVLLQTSSSSCPGRGARALSGRQPRGDPASGHRREVAVYDTRSGERAAQRASPTATPRWSVRARATGSPSPTSSRRSACPRRASCSCAPATCAPPSAGVRRRRPDPRRRLDAGAGPLTAHGRPRTRSARSTSSRPAPLLGNPVAVVHDADDLDDAQMQLFAQWTNLSETTFLLRPTTAEADYRLRIFTPAASCRSPATRRSAARTRGSRPVVRRRATDIVQECDAGLVTIERGERLAFQAPPLLRDGPVEDAGPRPRSPRASASARRRRRRQVGGQRPGLGRRTARRRPRRPGPRARPRRVRRTGHRRRRARGGTAARDADVEVRAFDCSTEDPVTGSLNASLGQWLAGDRAARAVRRRAGHRDRPAGPGAREAGGEHGVGGRRHPHDAPRRGRALGGAGG